MRPAPAPPFLPRWQVRAWSSQVSGGAARKDDDEGGAGSFGAVDQQLAWCASTMLWEMDSPKPTPEGASLVVKNGSKIRSHRLGNALARVADGELEASPPTSLQADPERSAFRHRRDGVLDDVRDRFLDLRRVALRLAAGEIGGEVDSVARIWPSYSRGRRAPTSGAGNAVPAVPLLLGERAQVGDHVRDPQRLLLQDRRRSSCAVPSDLCGAGRRAGDGSDGLLSSCAMPAPNDPRAASRRARRIWSCATELGGAPSTRCCSSAFQRRISSSRWTLRRHWLKDRQLADLVRR